MRRLRIEIWHNNEQHFYWEHDNAGFFFRLKLAVAALFASKKAIVLSTNEETGTTATKQVGDRKYKL